MGLRLQLKRDLCLLKAPHPNVKGELEPLVILGIEHIVRA